LSSMLFPYTTLFRSSMYGGIPGVVGKYVTVIIDLTPISGKTGPARLLDMVEGRSKAVFKLWLAGRLEEWRDGIEVVAMDGFTGLDRKSTRLNSSHVS